ncbi:MAG: hypothetical protein BV456_04625 [Thermoplasmata archaeon M8B2D]|nr:MAG: hypothetical protein BV456_04625 [Thermoplasmata archaeon M8B2D]
MYSITAEIYIESLEPENITVEKITKEYCDVSATYESSGYYDDSKIELNFRMQMVESEKVITSPYFNISFFEIGGFKEWINYWKINIENQNKTGEFKKYWSEKFKEIMEDSKHLESSKNYLEKENEKCKK